MSFPTHQPAAPEREESWSDKVKAWHKDRKAAGVYWLLLLSAVAFVSAAFDAWFLGAAALAWHYFVPVVKWYYGVGTGTKRNLRWNLGRFGIFLGSAATFGVLWYTEDFAMAVLLPVLAGISIPLWKKRDWTMLGAIWAGVVFFAEFSNGASLAAAVILSAVINYERKKARLATMFDKTDLQSRPVTPRPTGITLTDPYADVPLGYFRGDRPDETGVVAQPHTEDPYAGYPPVPPHLPLPGERDGQEEHRGEAHTSTPERPSRPAHLPPTGRNRGEETGEHSTGVSRTVPGMRRPFPPVESSTGTHQVPEDFPAKDGPVTGLHTTEFHVPEQQDGPPVHRRRVLPPEGYTPPQG